ncbi:MULTISPECIES: hypothetical protein [Pseudomonas]|jgi:hypothetical protein|uniref:Uncharacterized protein n=1 Tax=Pseudomonas simiae TaxID=321846 RepID=A0A1N7UG47_9PSED|nr:MULTISPECIES: hypothetical protein [Pseudomonas]PHX45765.1 hypothetical protein AO284_24510 [Pseudomonas sp. NZIPFR-PS2]VVN70360.1 hypothetical protein PS706_00390 [Pseudomonas fluorescens]AIB38081.1 hypothetical protein PS417_21350 [Pseudomonas simiae]AJP53890.1 hypothetical protein PF1751_v1c41950 [Pseudomonas simiae]AJZ97115.1 hypothetical protein PFLUOLIPICF7_15195 [Pseudomonas simiae]
MKNSKFAALALTGLLSAASLSAFAASSTTGPTDPTPDATTESQKSMGTGMDTNGGAVIDNGADPRTKGNDTQRQAPAAVGNGKMGPAINQPNINKGDDSNVPGAPKQPAP